MRFSRLRKRVVFSQPTHTNASFTLSSLRSNKALWVSRGVLGGLISQSGPGGSASPRETEDRTLVGRGKDISECAPCQHFSSDFQSSKKIVPPSAFVWQTLLPGIECSEEHRRRCLVVIEVNCSFVVYGVANIRTVQWPSAPQQRATSSSCFIFKNQILRTSSAH